MLDRPITRVLERLKGARRSGSNYNAKCPAHEDREPSLSIKEGNDGRVLLNCHKGCSTEAVVQALGLQMTDLFPPKPYAEEKPLADPKARARMVRTYDYTDEDGVLLFQACRFVGTDGKKTFRQRRPDPDRPGEWIWSLGETRHVLYRLPEVIEAVAAGKTIYVVEGEKDAETLILNGYVATTNPMGAGKWRDEYAEALRGASVVILPDYDEVGAAHAETVANSCKGHGAVVKIVALPGLPPKGDVSDWLDPKAGHDLDEFDAIVTRTPTYQFSSEKRTRWRLDELLENDAIMRPPPPIVPRLAWAGRSTLFAASEKSGKSTLIGFVAAQVSCGGYFLGDPCATGDVLVIGPEEFIGDAARRLRHFGANPARVHLVDRFAGDPGDRPQEVRAHIEATSPVLVIVDTLMAYSIGAITDAASSSQMQPVVQQLTDIAHGTGVAVVLIHHARKSDGRYRDSSAIGGAVDLIVEMFAPDEDADPTLRRLRARGRVPVPSVTDCRFDGDTFALAAQGTQAPLETRILRAVSERPGCSVNDVAEAVGARRSDVQACVTRLLAGGEIRNEAQGTRWMTLYVPAWRPGATT
jgi:hypothetical protein